MNAEIELLSATQINWDSLRSTMDKAINIRVPSSSINFSEDAEYLLNIALFNKIQYKDPLTLLRKYPHHLLKFLHYSFMVACSETTYMQFSYATSLDIIPCKVGDVSLLLVAGTLDEWYNTIIYNLQERCTITFLIDKFLIAFEKRGLGYLFERYSKVPLKEGIFLLEKR